MLGSEECARDVSRNEELMSRLKQKISDRSSANSGVPTTTSVERYTSDEAVAPAAALVAKGDYSSTDRSTGETRESAFVKVTGDLEHEREDPPTGTVSAETAE